MFNHIDDIYPATFVVFDIVTSSDASFKKTWQIHSIEESVISGNTATIQRTASHYPQGPSGGSGNYSGKLAVQNLLPVDAIIQKTGGAGYDCWVDYEIQNYPPDPDGKNYDFENGMWRIEVSPASDRLTDHFLNVMDVNINSKPEVSLIENDQLTGLKILDRMVCFNKTETATVQGKCIYFVVPPGDYTLSGVTNSIAMSNNAGSKNALLQNFPNPFNAVTRIDFTLENKSDVILEIYDIKGRKVQTLLSRTLEKGDHVVYWEGKNRTNSVVTSGMYLCKLRFGEHVFTRKILLIT